MSRPDDIPQDVWDKAYNALPPVIRKDYDRSPVIMVMHLGIAQAIASERDRCAMLAFAAYERKNEICSKIVRRIRSGEGLVR